MANLERWVLDLDAWRSGRKGSLSTGEAVSVNDGCALDRSVDQLRASLARTIESEIVPRLMLAHQAVKTADFTGRRRLGPADVEEFARLVVAHDEVVALTFVETLRAQGVTLDAICLDLLSNTARYLGELWEADRCDFTDVTIGLWRLHGVLRQLCPPFRGEGAAASSPVRRVLLSPLPGEQHSFGATIVCEFFRRAGWDVTSGPFINVSDLTAAVKRQLLDVVGLSISGEKQIDPLTALIRAVRKGSRNQAVAIMVGGRVFADAPHLARAVGADATAPDAEGAVRVAERLVRQGVAR